MAKQKQLKFKGLEGQEIPSGWVEIIRHKVYSQHSITFNENKRLRSILKKIEKSRNRVYLTRTQQVSFIAGLEKAKQIIKNEIEEV